MSCKNKVPTIGNFDYWFYLKLNCHWLFGKCQIGVVSIAGNVDGFAQADQIKTTLRPSDTKIQFYFSEASTQRLVQNRMLCAVALFELNTVGHQNPGHCANRWFAQWPDPESAGKKTFFDGDKTSHFTPGIKKKSVASVSCRVGLAKPAFPASAAAHCKGFNILSLFCSLLPVKLYIPGSLRSAQCFEASKDCLSVDTSTVGAIAYNVTACCCAGIHCSSSLELKPIEKLMLKLTTKSQIEFGQARY